MIDLRRSALLPGLRGASFLGPHWGRQERPRVSKLSLLEKNNNNHRCLPTWVGVALWKWRRRREWKGGKKQLQACGS